MIEINKDGIRAYIEDGQWQCKDRALLACLGTIQPSDFDADDPNPDYSLALEAAKVFGVRIVTLPSVVQTGLSEPDAEFQEAVIDSLFEERGNPNHDSHGRFAPRNSGGLVPRGAGQKRDDIDFSDMFGTVKAPNNPVGAKKSVKKNDKPIPKESSVLPSGKYAKEKQEMAKEFPDKREKEGSHFLGTDGSVYSGKYSNDSHSVMMDSVPDVLKKVIPEHLNSNGTFKGLSETTYAFMDKMKLIQHHRYKNNGKESDTYVLPNAHPDNFKAIEKHFREINPDAKDLVSLRVVVGKKKLYYMADPSVKDWGKDFATKRRDGTLEESNQVTEAVLELLEEKGNPFHDSLGRFASRGAVGFGGGLVTRGARQMRGPNPRSGGAKPEEGEAKRSKSQIAADDFVAPKYRNKEALRKSVEIAPSANETRSEKSAREAKQGLALKTKVTKYLEHLPVDTEVGEWTRVEVEGKLLWERNKKGVRGVFSSHAVALQDPESSLEAAFWVHKNLTGGEPERPKVRAASVGTAANPRSQLQVDDNFKKAVDATLSGEQVTRVGTVAVPKKKEKMFLSDAEKNDLFYEPTPEELASHPYKIPPSYFNVRIAKNAEFPIHAIVKSATGKELYLYTNDHHAQSKVIKFARAKTAMQIMPKLFKSVEADAKAGNPDALAMQLINKTSMRVGSAITKGAKYVKDEDYEQYGASTLQMKHVRIGVDNKLYINFPGKHSVGQRYVVDDPTLVKYVSNRMGTAGRSDKLFDTLPHRVEGYFKNLNGNGTFTPKDVRTYIATDSALRKIATMRPPATLATLKTQRLAVGEHVSKILGNKPAESLKSYIDPMVFEEWEMSLLAKEQAGKNIAKKPVRRKTVKK